MENINEKFIQACDEGNFSKCKDFLNYIDPEILNMQIEHLIKGYQYESLQILFTDTFPLHQLNSTIIGLSCQYENNFVLKAICKANPNFDINELNNNNNSLNNYHLQFKIEDILYDIKNNTISSKEQLEDLSNFRLQFINDCCNEDIPSIVNNLNNIYVNRFSIPFRFHVFNNINYECNLDSNKNTINKICELLNNNFFLDLETNNYYLERAFINNINILHLMIEKGANFRKLINDTWDSGLKDQYIKFWNENYPEPDVKVAK